MTLIANSGRYGNRLYQGLKSRGTGLSRFSHVMECVAVPLHPQTWYRGYPKTFRLGHWQDGSIQTHGIVSHSGVLQDILLGPKSLGCINS